MTEEFKIGKHCIGVGCGALIFNDKKEVLLMKRSKNSKNQALWWSQPGGAVDFNEKAIVATKREIKEELGIDIDIWAEVPHIDHVLKKEQQHWMAIPFLAKIKKGVPKIMEPNKCDEIGWFALDNLPSKLTQTTKGTIKSYLEKKYIKL
ncbi:MAG: MutT/NUDIX family protein [Candidatus Moranbacteria bacterium GW2011_GWE1_36_7]|nr:MAG: MutT/NUDIX family protein [Candidatus Moranbacteria bacterium GW2011_GWD2_36_12]KKQ07043.1 MAG: MutT/NUDIX family protein [Candidatus Moranbacteria bacterium GW2011_GWE2_36_40]KKQ15379.1 MAG: MutT/NUDIX family protein [Candidatus Moranbacteria bacterium GW2011_GWE1_36_7]